MNDETIIKPEYKKEFVAAFKKLTMSGAVGADAAIAKLIKNKAFRVCGVNCFISLANAL